MGEKFKNSKFFKKLKELKSNKTFLVTAVTVVLALSLVITLAALTNRAKKLNTDTNLPLDDGSIDSDLKNPSSNNTQNPSESKKPAPTFSLVPAENGAFSKGHDATLQVYSATTNDYRVHLGMDIMTAENAPVYAAEAGKVSQIWEDPMMGWCVAVSHEGEYCTFYKNLSKDLAEGIETGVSVEKGQQLGTVGSSAWLEIAEEPHLHFEMTLAGVSVDPAEHLTESALNMMRYDKNYEDK